MRERDTDGQRERERDPLSICVLCAWQGRALWFQVQGREKKAYKINVRNHSATDVEAAVQQRLRQLSLPPSVSVSWTFDTMERDIDSADEDPDWYTVGATKQKPLVVELGVLLSKTHHS